MASLRLKTFLSAHSRNAAQAERGFTEEWKCTWEKFSPAFVLQWSSLHHSYEHFYQLLLSDITPMAKSDLSSFLCPSFVYFGLINGLYTDLELILRGFSFFFCFTKWTSPFISRWKWTSYQLHPLQYFFSKLYNSDDNSLRVLHALTWAPHQAQGCSLCLFL